MSGIEKCLVLSNRQVSSDMFIMDLKAPLAAQKCIPGQFLHVRPGYTDDPLLRRPLSIFDADADRGTISFLYRVVGKGTEMLAEIKAQAHVDIMGPLGRGFTLPNGPENILLVGGGVGIAPLLYLGRVLQASNCRVTVLFGAGSAEQLAVSSQFEELGIRVLSASVDGSVGFKGLVTDMLPGLDNTGSINRVYTCGPEPMMQAVADWAKVHDIGGQVSLEEYMACGVGACLGCARQLQPFSQNYVKVCQDGPVFDFDEVSLYKSMT